MLISHTLNKDDNLSLATLCNGIHYPEMVDELVAPKIHGTQVLEKLKYTSAIPE